MNTNVLIFLIGLAVIGSLIYMFVFNSGVDDSMLDLEEGDPTIVLNNGVNLGQEFENMENAIASVQYDNPPEMILEDGVDYSAVLVTNKGEITINLFQDEMPITVNNFVFLAQEGFYDGILFHRIVEDFMVQAGDPLTKSESLKSRWGSGGPGYRFDDEPFENEYVRGTLAMANSGRNTNGSQFFIMHKDTELPPAYTIFGRIEDDASLEVLDAIAEVEVTQSATGELSSPIERVEIETINILTN